MKRIPFSKVLKDASIDIHREYDRLFEMFYVQKFPEEALNSLTLRDLCAAHFVNLPFRGTCISLDDFDEFYGYHFDKTPLDFNFDYLISFCEYSYNIAIYNQENGRWWTPFGLSQPMQLYVQQVTKVIDAVGYMANSRNGITDFVPKDQAAISVTEIVDPTLSYRIIEYNHHSMKGDLESKRATLIALADKLEPKREKLKHANSALKSDLFYLLNNVNVRHNNAEYGGKNYIHYVANMKNSDIEQWYDEIYQMCLLAFLELDHLERKDLIKKLKEDVQKDK